MYKIYITFYFFPLAYLSRIYHGTHNKLLTVAAEKTLQYIYVGINVEPYMCIPTWIVIL